jgi:hypothetical protein
MKKEKKTSKEKGGKEARKDDILEELAESLKRLPAGKAGDEDESGLEKDSGLDLDDLEFQSFMRRGESGAPVLERIAGSQIRPVFVGGIPQSSNAIPGEEKESDSFKYVPGTGSANEPKYIESDSHMAVFSERVDSMKAGRDFQGAPREAAFMSSAEARVESPLQERRWNAERPDFERERRKTQFEREEEKYDKYKPDLPKSR